MNRVKNVMKTALKGGNNSQEKHQKRVAPRESKCRKRARN